MRGDRTIDSSVEGIESLADGDDARAGGIDGEGPDLISADATLPKRALHRVRESVHLRAMALRCEIGVLGRAMQGVLCDTRTELPFTLAEERHTYAQCAEIDRRDDAQQLRSLHWSFRCGVVGVPASKSFASLRMTEMESAVFHQSFRRPY